MNKFLVFFIICTSLIFLGCAGQKSTIQNFQDGISIRGDYIYLNDKPFIINAVGYAGWRPGQWPGTDVVDINLMEADFRRIRDAGFNTIRTWDALNPAELDLAKKYGLYVIQGIWLDPTRDFMDPVFQRYASQHVTDVVNWSKDFDNILMYLVMTEPRQEAVLYSGVKETLDFFKSIKVKIQSIDHKPVSMDSWIPVGFMDHSLWDVVTFNVFSFVPESLNVTLGFSNYLRWIKEHHAVHKPLLIGETGGYSISSKKENEIGFGGNTEAEQSLGNMQCIHEALQAKAAGVVTVSWVDTWHYPSDPTTHDNEPWEWNGIVGFKNINDQIGEVRQFYHDIQKFNQSQRWDILPKISLLEQNKFEWIRGKEVLNGNQIIIENQILFNGRPLSNYPVNVAIFYPMQWKEQMDLVVTDSDGKFKKVYNLSDTENSQYVILSVGTEIENERYGDLDFLFLDLGNRSPQKDNESFYIYRDKFYPGNHFIPSGWVGDYKDLNFNDEFKDECFRGASCLRLSYSSAGSSGKNWAGIYWQSVLNNWENENYRYDLSQYHQLTFWAKGEVGGEKISEVGIGGRESNSADKSVYNINLTAEWKQYSIDLTEKDITSIIQGFHVFFLANDSRKPSTVYLDDIRFEK